MTSVDFHFNVPQPLDYACRLLRKTHGLGLQALVLGPDHMLNELDQRLWTFSQLDFIPHERLPHPAQIDGVDAAPVLLANGVPDGGARQVLVNLGEDVPDGFESFDRLVEIVSMAEPERVAARRRWKHYADRGYAIARHDAADRVTT